MRQMEAGSEERTVYLKSSASPSPPVLPERHEATAAATATMAVSQSSFCFPPDWNPLDNINFYNGPTPKLTASSQCCSNHKDDNWFDINTIIAPKKSLSRKSKKKKRALTPTMATAKVIGLLYSGMS